MMKESSQSYNMNDIMVYTLLSDIHYCALLLFVNMYKVNKKNILTSNVLTFPPAVIALLKSR